MNARGKKLTEFDIFKSDMMSTIKKCIRRVEGFVLLRWTRNGWILFGTIQTRQFQKTNALDITNDADKKYSILFQNIFKLEFIAVIYVPSLGYQEPTIQNILSDADNIYNL